MHYFGIRPLELTDISCYTNRTFVLFGDCMLAASSLKLNVYNPRQPRKSSYYRLIEAHYEELERVWEEKYQSKYGFWRPYVMNVIYRYLDCGDPHFGFARVKCEDCGNEYILPFSCKRRHFCPSCHQKRVVEFGEHLHDEVLQEVRHRQWVFSIPKRLRPYFMYDRKLLSKLSQCAWKVLSDYLKQSVTVDNPIPACVIAVQTFGEFLNFNPHLHVIATDGCFFGDGEFAAGITPKAEDLILPFAMEVFKLLEKEGKINGFIIDNMLSWQHGGFNVYCGQAVSPFDDDAVERLSQYIVRAPISQERMTYVPAQESPDGKAKVVYEGKTSRVNETFSALDWLARLITHIPGKGEQMVRYYGYYSNKSRGMRKKIDTPPENSTVDAATTIIESDLSRKKFKKNWARLIQKVYFVDPLLCPKCSGKMRIISFIEDDATIKKILMHLNLWDPQNHDPPPGPNKGIPLHTQAHRSYEWWEAVNHISGGEGYADYSSQMSYEDSYSQEVPYEY